MHAYITPFLLLLYGGFPTSLYFVVDTFLHSCIGTGFIPQLDVLPAPAAITSVATMNPQEISQTGAHPVIPHPQTNSLTSPGLRTISASLFSWFRSGHKHLSAQASRRKIGLVKETRPDMAGKA